MYIGGEDMKIKYEGTGIEITDRDSKNLISFVEYWLELPDKDRQKLILGSVGVTTYFSVIYLLLRRREK